VTEQRVAGVAIRVGDLERAAEFYTAVFGMQRVARYETPELTEILMGYEATPGAPNLVLVDRVGHTRTPDANAANDGLDRVLLMVDDARGACKRLLDAGGQVVREPHDLDEHPVTIAIVQDLDGHPLELIEMRSVAEDG
jgi:lactoylglutathione lyase